MDAFILAAGRGERLRPLTDHTPKPLVTIGALSLIEIHLLRLKEAGFRRIIINISHLGEMIRDYLGDGSRYGVSIVYSPEADGALETAGGIVNALELIESEQFIVVNADIFCDYPYHNLITRLQDSKRDLNCHLILVKNPAHHPSGDFSLKADQLISPQKTNDNFTFAGIACYQRQLFATIEPGKQPLKPLLDQQIKQARVSGEHYEGLWYDIGTLQRLNVAKQDPSVQKLINTLQA